MRERVSQPKKATNASFSIPTLKQPTRGFGLNSSDASPQVATEVQPLNKPLSHDISRISLRPQTKLTVNQPGDVYEQEADRVASQVMQRMSEPANNQPIQREELPEEEELQMKSLGDSTIPSLQREELPEEEELQMKSLGDSTIPSLQREELPEEEEDQLQMKSLGDSTIPSLQREALPEEEDQLQMKSLGDSITPLVQRKSSEGGVAATSDVETSIQQARGSGQPLSDDIRQPMEQAFGTDFGGVKIHTDSRSHQLNQSIQARAFTTGQDIFFRQGEYAPQSHGGKELLAHELTHVVQQNGSAVQPKTLPKETVKKNKIQTKSLLTSPADFQPPIQRRENPQQETQPDKQGKEQVGLKPDAEKQQEQRQDAANKSVAVASPPAVGVGAAGSSGNPPATQNSKNPQRQTQGDQPAEPKAKQANPEQGEMQGQAPVGKAGVGTALPSTEKGAVSAEAGGEKAPDSANDDPAFQAVVGTTKDVAAEQKKHEPAQNKAQEAQAAAQPPSNEVDSKAQANQVGEMGQAETPNFDAAAFKAKLMERIADIAPKTLEEADEFKNNNKLDSVKGDLSGKVDEEQKASQEPLEEKAKEKPDTSGIESKKVTPLPETNPGTAPSDIDAKKAAPKSKGKSQVEAPLQQESKKLDQQMVEANVTEEQLANSNEPEFEAALTAKKNTQTNATQAPQQYRQQEQNLLTNAQATAQATAQQQLQGMHGVRTQQLGQVGNQQVGAKGKDEQARAKVAGDINKIYDKTKGIVEKTLGDLDSQVQQEFDTGAAEAKKAFEDYVDQRMKAYKDDRYSGIIGKAKWLKDKLFGMPSEVNAFYQEGRQLYIDKMDGVINKVVAIISKGLTQAKAEITKGKQEIQTYVNQLPQDLKGVGQQAAADIESKFDALEQSVKDKEDELIETLAQKYQENLEAVDARIDEMKAANQGLVQKAFDAIVGVIKTIIELTKMLMEVLARVAGVVGQILKDPIGFLGNLIQALKQGFLNFMNNIGKHLQKGLIGWLTGTMAESGIEMPEKFDLKGIFSLVSQVLGFTYQVIRAQAVKRLGEQKVGYLEQKFEIFQILASEGISGIWQFVKERMGDLNELVIQPIKNFVIEKVVIAGIEWVISLLTPASAFVKAAKAIYQIISFFIERAQQIGDLINAILDAVSAIASGAIDQAVKGVENALAKSLPVVISFLASLLGLGGIAGKVQAIFQKLRSPVEKAVDWIIDKGAKAANKVGKKFKKSKFGKKANAVKESALKKKEAAQEWANKKKEAAEQRFEEKKQAINNRLEEKKNQLMNTKAGKKLAAANEAAQKKLEALEEKRQAFNNKVEAAKEWPRKKLEAVENKAEELKETAKDKFKQSKLGQKLDFGKDNKGNKGKKGKESDEEKDLKPIEKPFSMNGVQHTLIVTPSLVPKLEMASKRDLLSNKIGRVISQLMRQEPRPEEQIGELKGIAQLAKHLQTEAKKARLDPKTKLNQVPGFDSDFNALVAAIQSYGQRYQAKDIEQALAKSSTQTKEQAFKTIVDKARHVPPAQYNRGKHWKGKSEDERRASSKNNGPGQFLYSMTGSDVKQLERETLLTGEVIDKGSGTYHAFKQFDSVIGYANGKDAYWLRAELTSAESSAPTVHSHPRLSKG